MTHKAIHFFFSLLLFTSFARANDNLSSLREGMEKENIAEEVPAYARTERSRTLVILLDDSEKNDTGPAHDSLYTALSQKAVPLLVSTSLLARALSEYGDESLIKDNVTEQYIDLRNSKNQESRGREIRQILLKAVAFDPDEWVIRRTDEYLTLLIPKVYLARHGIAEEMDKEASEKLGLKMSTMSALTSVKEIVEPPRPMETADYFVPALEKIFFTNRDLRGKDAKPNWTLYLIGHGLKFTQIVGLTISDFSNALDFFTTKIATRLLVYTSCYAAGVNTDIVFGNIKSKMAKTYPYPIITQIYADTPAVAPLLFVKGTKDNLTMDTALDFQGFVENTEKTLTFKSAAKKETTVLDDIDYEKAAGNLFPIVPSDFATEYMIEHVKKERPLSVYVSYENVPQIKLPGLPWFSVMATRATDKTGQKRREAVSIGSILAKTREQKSTLDIVSYFKTDPSVLLLYASNMPFTIKLGKNLKTIVSMVPGGGTHVIDRIVSDDLTTTQIILSFLRFEMLLANPVFFVGEIAGKDQSIFDVVIKNEGIEGNKRLGIQDTFVRTAHYTFDGNIYGAKARNRFLATPSTNITEAEKIDYERAVARYKGEILKLGSFQAGENRPGLFVPPLALQSSSALIEEIIPLDEKIKLTSVLNFIARHVAPSDGVVAIKKMRGAGDDLDMGCTFNFLLQRCDQREIMNVVVDNPNRTLFLTYDNKFYRYDFPPYGSIGKKEEVTDDYFAAYLQPRASLAPANEGTLLPVSVTKSDIETIKSRLDTLKKRFAVSDEIMPADESMLDIIARIKAGVSLVALPVSEESEKIIDEARAMLQSEDIEQHFDAYRKMQQLIDDSYYPGFERIVSMPRKELNLFRADIIGAQRGLYENALDLAVQATSSNDQAVLAFSFSFLESLVGHYSMGNKASKVALDAIKSDGAFMNALGFSLLNKIIENRFTALGDREIELVVETARSDNEVKSRLAKAFLDVIRKHAVASLSSKNDGNQYYGVLLLANLVKHKFAGAYDDALEALGFSFKAYGINFDALMNSLVANRSTRKQAQERLLALAIPAVQDNLPGPQLRNALVAIEKLLSVKNKEVRSAIVKLINNPYMINYGTKAALEAMFKKKSPTHLESEGR